MVGSHHRFVHLIRSLRSTFATHGIPESLVSDNGTAFTSDEFKQFTKKNGIRHVTSTPYHPASNGLAERAVQTFKEGMKKTDGDIETRLTRFLFQYRITPHSTTGQSPAELLMSRKPRSHLDMMLPDLTSRVQGKQSSQKAVHDHHARERNFDIAQDVFVRQIRQGRVNWKPGTIVAVNGPLSYTVCNWKTDVPSAVMLITFGRGRVSHPPTWKTQKLTSYQDLRQNQDIRKELAPWLFQLSLDDQHGTANHRIVSHLNSLRFKLKREECSIVD